MYVYFYLFTRAGLARLDAAYVEAAKSLGAGRWRTAFAVTLPLLSPALSGAALLTFMTSLASFSAPYVFGGSFRVMTTQIVASKLNGDMGLAMVETVTLAVVGFAGLYLLRRTEARSVVGTVRGVAPRRALAGGRFVVAAAGWALAALLLLPHASLILLSFVPRNTWTTEALPPVLNLGNYASLFRAARAPAADRQLALDGHRRDRRRPRAGISRGRRRGARTPQRPFRARERPRVAHRGALGAPRHRVRRGPRGGLLGAPAGRRALRARRHRGDPAARLSGAEPAAHRPRRVRRACASSIRRSKRPPPRSARAPGGACTRIVLPHLKPALLAGASLAFLSSLGDFVVSIVLYTYSTRPISIEILSALRLQEIGVAAAYGVLLTALSAAAFLAWGRRA